MESPVPRNVNVAPVPGDVIKKSQSFPSSECCAVDERILTNFS